MAAVNFGWCNNMKTLMRIFYLCVVLALLSAEADAGRKEQTIERWLADQLAPAMVQKLGGHPRFRDQVVRFAVFEKGDVVALTSKLAVELKQDLQTEVLNHTPMQVAWQGATSAADAGAVDCTRNEVDYYVGIELSETGGGNFLMQVDVVDANTNTSVPGFHQQWTGKLTAAQFRRFRQPEVDMALLGHRGAPFDESQADLLAAYLAHDLGCALLRELSGEYVAAISASTAESSDRLMTLVRNNLATYKALQISSDPALANSVIEARAHLVADDLYQYWITVTPISADSAMPVIGANAYAYMPEPYLPIMLAGAEQSAGRLPETELISTINIVQLQSDSTCAATVGKQARVIGSSETAQCYAIQAKMTQDTAVFLLYHQMNNGLVRVSTEDCNSRTSPRIARREQPLYFPLLLDTGNTPSWLSTSEWLANPATDTFYVIAVSNTHAARAIAGHLGHLPERCGTTLRPGLEGRGLRTWFEELDEISHNWPEAVDWRSVRVKNVY